VEHGVRPRLALRTRAAVGFGLTGLVVSVVLAGVTYGLVRRYLVQQREAAAVDQTYVNARLARSVLRTAEPDVPAFLAGLGGDTASTSVLRFRGEWFATSVLSGPDVLPDDLVRAVGDGRAGHQRVRDDDGVLQLAVGTPLPSVEAAYFELFSLVELERTLDVVGRVLAAGAVSATLAAAVVGRALAARIVRPLRPVADAAERIAAGALDTRLQIEPDPDLSRLVEAFNAMASSLEARIEREARFAADVSHELRSPLAAVTAAVEVIERRKSQLSDDVVAAIEVMTSKVETFQVMVLDLLEIARVDAGTARLELETIDVESLLTSLLQVHDVAASLTFTDDAPRSVTADRRRLAQSLANIIDNAAAYAGGVARVTVDGGDVGVVRIMLDDRGPGVPPEEREAIFGRFARGAIGLKQGTTSGTGLGLALVAEHIRLHGGSVWVEDAPDGGARFVVEIPAAGS
jgi:signal transduction histidine kinase